MTLQPDAQSGFFDQVIENEELERLLESHESYRYGAKQYAKVHKRLKEMLDGLEDGRRYRVGRFVVTPQPIAGGGFEIPEWKGQTYNIGALD